MGMLLLLMMVSTIEKVAHKYYHFLFSGRSLILNKEISALNDTFCDVILFLLVS